MMARMFFKKSAATKITRENVKLDLELRQANGVYTATSRQFNVSADGSSEIEAKTRLAQAVKAYLEDAQRKGTLKDVLAQAGAKTHSNTQQLEVDVRQENGVYVASIRQFNLSARGGTEADARAQLSEALKAFLEDAKSKGTLKDVLNRATGMKP
jgi:predicted RNase H-like HicB family nuclease